MSSWLKASLGNLSGLAEQVSTFTKEVITEGAEEVQDPLGELIVANGKLRDLSAGNTALLEERERLVAAVREQEARADAAESHIASISQEYRNLISAKDEELKAVYADRAALQERLEQLKLESLVPEHISPEKRGRALSVPRNLADDAPVEDLLDSVSSQAEINRLSTLVKALQADNERLKGQVASAGAEDGVITALQESVDRARSELARTIDAHQEELAALQNSHLAKLTEMSRAHVEDQEVLERDRDHAEKLAAALQAELAQVRASGATEDSSAAVLEELQAELQASQEAAITMSDTIKQLRTELAASRAHAEEARVAHEAETRRLRDAVAELEGTVRQYREREDTMAVHVGELQAKLQETDRQLETAHKALASFSADRPQSQSQSQSPTSPPPVPSPADKEEIETLTRKCAGLEADRARLEASVIALRERTAELERTHEQQLNDMLREEAQAQTRTVTALHDRIAALTADTQASAAAWAQERERLEEQLSTLNTQAEQRDGQLAKLSAELGHAQEALAHAAAGDAEAAAALRAQVDALAQANQRLEAERAALQQDIESLAQDKSALLLARETLQQDKGALVRERDAIAHERDAIARERDAAIEERAAVVHARDALAQERDALIEERDALALQSQGAHASQGEVRRLTDACEAAVSEARELEATKAQLEALLASLAAERRADAEARDTEIRRLGSMLGERDAALAALGAQLHAAETPASTSSEHQHQLSERDAAVAALRQQLAERDAAVAALRQQLAERDAALEAIEAQNEEERAQVQGIIQAKLARIADLEKSLASATAQGAQAAHDSALAADFEALKAKYATEMERFRTAVEGYEVRLAVAEAAKNEAAEALAHSVSSTIPVPVVASSPAPAMPATDDARLHALEAERDRLVRELEEERTIGNQTDGRLAEVDGALRAAQQTCVALTQQRDVAEHMLREAQERETQLRQVEATLGDEVMRLRKAYEAIDGEWKAARAEAERLRVACAELELKSKEVHEGVRSSVAETAQELANSQEELRAVAVERDRAQAQLTALQGHLMQIETRYTEDSVKRDETITFLQQQIQQGKVAAEQDARLMRTKESQLKQRISFLEDQCSRLTVERDRAAGELERIRAETAQLQTTCANLEQVLGDFEALKQTALDEVRAAMGDKVAAAEARVRDMLERVADSEAKMAAHAEDMRELQRLRTEANMEVGLAEALKNDVARLQRQLSQSQAQLADFVNNANTNLVDKRLIRNTVLTYFTAPDPDRKRDVLQLLSNLCSFSEDEQVKVGLKKKGLFSGWFSASASPSKGEPDNSFSSEFVQFLLNESQRKEPSKPEGPEASPFPASTAKPVLKLPPKSQHHAHNGTSGPDANGKGDASGAHEDRDVPVATSTPAKPNSLESLLGSQLSPNEM